MRLETVVAQEGVALFRLLDRVNPDVTKHADHA